jgi:hypothetical protein
LAIKEGAREIMTTGWIVTAGVHLDEPLVKRVRSTEAMRIEFFLAVIQELWGGAENSDKPYGRIAVTRGQCDYRDQ